MPHQELPNDPMPAQTKTYAERVMDTLREIDVLIEKIEHVEYARFDRVFAEELAADGLFTEEEVELLTWYIHEGNDLSGLELATSWLEGQLATIVTGSAVLGHPIRELDSVRVHITSGGPETNAVFRDSRWVKVTSSGDEDVEARLEHLAPLIWEHALEVYEWST